MSEAVTGDPEPMIGQRVHRVEDVRFLTGRGTYLADLDVPGLKHIAILRSPHAHALIRSIDIAPALESPGVVAAFTGAELARVSQPFSHLLPLPTIKPLEWYVLATDKVRFVGEPIAVVVAGSRYQAEDALEFIEVDYEVLPAVTDPLAATSPEASQLYDDWGSNEFLTLEYDTGDLDDAFAAADGVLAERFTQHRIIGLPMEGHGAFGSFDPGTGELLLHASSQQPHNLRTVVSDVTGLSEARIRVVAPDMGGGFGNKQHFMREESLVALVAMLVPHPVMWIQDRSESLAASVHSRDQVHEVELAYRDDGRVLGLRARIVADVGNPELYFTGAAPAMVTTSLMTGTYDIQRYAYQLTCVATNKCPLGAYRGFGQPQAQFSIERMMDLLAERLGKDPAEVRQLNMIPDDPRPYESATGAAYDVGSFSAQLEQVLDEVDYRGFRERQEAARAQGRHLGIGLGSMVEATAPNLHVVAGRYGGFEMALVTVQPDGQVTIMVGTKCQGQGHATMLAQVASDGLGVPLDHVRVEEGDTATLPYGMGTWGSRSAVMGGGAVLRATARLREKMLRIAAAMLEVPVEGVNLDDGMFRAGEAALPFAAVAGAAYLHTFLLPEGEEMGLSVLEAYDPGNTSAFPDERGRMNVAATYATAAAAVIVEVDVNTGHVAVEDAVIVHDCGRVINPMIVDGQIQGAFAQAVGAVLLEEILYGESGQPLTTSLLDYKIPTFDSVPRVRTVHRETLNALAGGFRGAGEAGIIVGPSALANAIHDALRPFGVTIRQTNLGAARLRQLLREAGHEIDPLAGVRLRGTNLAMS